MDGRQGSFMAADVCLAERRCRRASSKSTRSAVLSSVRHWRVAFAVVAAGLIASCQTPANRDGSADLVISDVTVIDPETRRVLPNRSVYVRGDRITAVVPSAAAGNRTAARTIDGAGRFLIPGLMDMHVHLFLPEAPAPTLNLLLANGVTSIREMASDCWAAAGMTAGCVDEYRRVLSRIEAGEVAGPDLVALTSTMVMGPTRLKLPQGAPSFITPMSGEDARTLVGYLASRGIDLVKTHDSIPSVAFRALMDGANRPGAQGRRAYPVRGGLAGRGPDGLS